MTGVDMRDVNQQHTLLNTEVGIPPVYETGRGSPVISIHGIGREGWIDRPIAGDGRAGCWSQACVKYARHGMRF